MVARAVRPLGLHLLLEPGRTIVGAAGILLTRVSYVKKNGSKTFVVVDAGMNDLMRPALYGAVHPITKLTREGGAWCARCAAESRCGWTGVRDRGLFSAGLAFGRCCGWGFVGDLGGWGLRDVAVVELQCAGRAAEVLVEGREVSGDSTEGTRGGFVARAGLRFEMDRL